MYMYTNDSKNAGKVQAIPPQPTADQAPEADFKQMGLSKIMLRALVEVGYEKPSPIQAALIPPALDGYDVIGQARTGTGKPPLLPFRFSNSWIRFPKVQTHKR